MRHLTEIEEIGLFQKLRKQRKQENVDTWSKEEKPWRQAQREKQKRKYSNFHDVV